jgi:hypothetical protein
MGWSRQERIAQHDKMVVMLPEVQAELKRRFPEVVSVDLGMRQVNGEYVEELAWRIFVKEKLPVSELKPEQILPKEIAGLITDVFTQVILREALDTNEYRPLWGGIQISSFRGGWGTMGCFVTDTLAGNNHIHLLSNCHVIGSQSGFIIGQPNAPTDSCCCCFCGGIAKVVRGIIGTVAGPNSIDAAIAKLAGQAPLDIANVHYANSIMQIGPVFGSDVGLAIGDRVRKRGRTTELTSGVVTSISFTAPVAANPPNPAATYTLNQIEIVPDAGIPNMVLPGDSGSAIVNNRNQVVGLIAWQGGANAYGNLISNVIANLNVAVLNSSGGTAGTLPLGAIGAVAPPVTARPNTVLTRLESRLKESQQGLKLLNTVHENFGEVLDLINDNREVKVAWNRYQGPAFVGHVVKKMQEPLHPFPDQVDGYSLQNLLIKMSDVLERNGSRRLAQAVEEYATVAFDFADHYKDFDSIDRLLENANLCPTCGQPQNLNYYV